MSKNDNKEQDILHAAEKLFAEKGFKGATKSLIADEAGVNNALLQKYKSTKQQRNLNVNDTNSEK